jgi:hypothetical protein
MTDAVKLPPLGRLHELLKYDQDTGSLTWRFRPSEMFGNEARAKQFNTAFGGREFGCMAAGYKKGMVDGRLYLAHRIIWKMVHGADPDGDIDHINGDRADNRIANLRVVTRRDNCRNVRRRKSNRSGANGVTWYPRYQKWKVRIIAKGKDTHLGYFSDLQEAIDTRKAAEKKYGYHKNHGNRVVGASTTT